MLIHRHIDAISASAHHNTQVARVISNIRSYSMSEVGVVYRIERIRTAVHNMMAKLG